MSKKLYAGQVPWGPDGPQSFPENWFTGEYSLNGEIVTSWSADAYAINKPPIWRDNVPFEAKMTVIGQSRGRSAVRFILEDEQGVHYYMFMTEMLALIQETTIVKGVVSGTWAFAKKGQNYGLTRLKPKKVKK